LKEDTENRKDFWCLSVLKRKRLELPVKREVTYMVKEMNKVDVTYAQWRTYEKR